MMTDSETKVGVDTIKQETDSGRKSGIARIKQEYLVLSKGQVINWDHLPDDEAVKKDKLEEKEGGEGEKRAHVDDRDLNPTKRFKLKGQNKNKLRYKIGQKNTWSRGKKTDGADDNEANDDNPRAREKIDKSTRLCLKFMDRKCPYEERCEYSHDLHKIYKLNEQEYFDADKPCYIYSTYGRCQFGVACLFANNHIHVSSSSNKVYNLYNHRQWSLNGGRADYTERYSNKLEINVQQQLRKKSYDFNVVSKIMNSLYKADANVKEDEENDDGKPQVSNDGPVGAAFVDDYLQGRDFQRKTLDFKGKLYLAPLTTVGNLPFRRLCKKYQCDITCAEMSLCTSLLNGNPSEWSHLKRHDSEDIFGVQITAVHPDHATKIAKVLNDQCELDFIDFNCGCPTEWIYQSGAGAGLMSRPSKLRKMIAGASMVSKVPITIKMRAGCHEGKNTAHNLINSVIKPFTSKYVGAITIHGRSRAQRYTKLADWDYVNECGRYADDIPVLGSGDCISWQEYYSNLDKYENISGVMIARGALISPWLFTEIKERRTWDITSKERLEIIGDFVNFALDHWGSDATGVENSRRYLLEWLSFACRYIPVGLLEVLPQKINERPPKYKGRDELETLLSSPAASDWIKISEMFLGKVPDNFKFLPKHKSNAYESVVEG